jgi:hypothetical protein
MVDKLPIRHSCPFCKAEPGRPCKNAAGRRLLGFHRHRYLNEKAPNVENLTGDLNHVEKASAHRIKRRTGIE